MKKKTKKKKVNIRMATDEDVKKMSQQKMTCAEFIEQAKRIQMLKMKNEDD